MILPIGNDLVKLLQVGPKGRLWAFRKSKQIHSSSSSYGGSEATKVVIKMEKRGDNSRIKGYFEKQRKTP